MANSNVPREEKRLYEIAEEYKRRGYRVTVAPTSNQLPRFLSKFRPDIVAEGPHESIVIHVLKPTPKSAKQSAAQWPYEPTVMEAKLPGQQRDINYWKKLSSVVRRHPGWRHELVLDDPSRRDMPETISQELIQERLQEGQRLAEQGMVAASLLITWSAAEAAMRLAGQGYELDLPDWRPATVISRLYTDGVLEREDYDFLLECLQIRNAVAHGFYEGRIRLHILKKLRQLALRLLP
jgi:hypothetical protein